MTGPVEQLSRIELHTTCIRPPAFWRNVGRPVGWGIRRHCQSQLYVVLTTCFCKRESLITSEFWAWIVDGVAGSPSCR
eukprot:130992-Chlamydomonas_euryale.AAC.5